MSCESLSAFRAEVLEFRKSIVDERIMGSPCLREALVAGLTHSWINLKLSTREHAEADAAVRSALDDYSVIVAIDIVDVTFG